MYIWSIEWFVIARLGSITPKTVGGRYMHTSYPFDSLHMYIMCQDWKIIWEMGQNLSVPRFFHMEGFTMASCQKRRWGYKPSEFGVPHVQTFGYIWILCKRVNTCSALSLVAETNIQLIWGSPEYAGLEASILTVNFDRDVPNLWILVRDKWVCPKTA